VCKIRIATQPLQGTAAEPDAVLLHWPCLLLFRWSDLVLQRQTLNTNKQLYRQRSPSMRHSRQSRNLLYYLLARVHRVALIARFAVDGIEIRLRRH